MDASCAAEIICSHLLNEGNARQNMAIFCQTAMEDEAIELMAETLDKNAIDKSEYPQTAELENRCVKIIADLWHAQKDRFIGTSTVGSSEGCMSAGMAMKFRWRNMAKARGLDIHAQMPNSLHKKTAEVIFQSIKKDLSAVCCIMRLL